MFTRSSPKEAIAFYHALRSYNIWLQYLQESIREYDPQVATELHDVIITMGGIIKRSEAKMLSSLKKENK